MTWDQGGRELGAAKHKANCLAKRAAFIAADRRICPVCGAKIILSDGEKFGRFKERKHCALKQNAHCCRQGRLAAKDKPAITGVGIASGQTSIMGTMGIFR